MTLEKLIVLIFISFLFSCESMNDQKYMSRRDSVDLQGGNNGLELLWFTDIDRGLIGFSKPAIVDDIILLGSQHNITGKFGEISGYDINTGNKMWTAGDLEPNNILYPLYDTWIFGNNVFTFYSGNMTAIDIHSGAEVFDQDLSQADAGNALYSLGSLYYCIVDRPDPFEEARNTAILKINPYNFSFDTIVTSQSQGPDWRERLKQPVAYKSSSGDTLLSYARRNYRAEPRTINHQLEVWNMSKNRMEWTFRTDEIIETSSFARHPSEVVGKYLYVSAGEGGMLCFDKDSGDLLWHHNPRGGVGLGGYYIYKDLVIILTEGAPPWRVALNRYTGEQVWIENNKGSAGIPEELDGIIYYDSGGTLTAVNAMTGDKKIEMKAAFHDDNSNLFFGPGIAIDKERRLLIATDYKHVLCYKIPRSLSAYQQPEEALRVEDN